MKRSKKLSMLAALATAALLAQFALFMSGAGADSTTKSSGPLGGRLIVEGTDNSDNITITQEGVRDCNATVNGLFNSANPGTESPNSCLRPSTFIISGSGTATVTPDSGHTCVSTGTGGLLTGTTVVCENVVVDDILVNAKEGNDGVAANVSVPTIIHGNGGRDSLTGGSKNDQIFGDGGDDLVLSGMDGNDALFGNDGNDALLDGGAGVDTLEGGAGKDVLDGGAGGDTLKGEAGDDALDGQAGNDTLDSGLGDDALNGHEGNDTLASGPGDDALNGHEGNDTLDGGSGDDALNGGAANDILDGGPGDDDLNGGAADDTLNGGPDSDVMHGGDDEGAGTDLVDYSSSTANLEVTLNESATGNDGEVATTVPPFAGEGDNVHSDVENVNGGSGDDTITGPESLPVDNLFNGNAGTDTLSGGPGNDVLNGEDNVTGIEVLNGGAGVDTLEGGNGVDQLNGDAGADILRGGAEADTLNGGTEDDDAYGGDGGDQINGETGDDLLFGGSGYDLADGGETTQSEDCDPCTVNLLDKPVTSVDAADGSDTINGGEGDDRLIGNGGNDTLIGGSHNLVPLIGDNCDGGPGVDTEDTASCETGNVKVSITFVFYVDEE